MFFSAFCEKGPFLNLKILHNTRYTVYPSSLCYCCLDVKPFFLYTRTLPKHQRNTQTECRVYSLIFRVANVLRLFVVDKVYWYNLPGTLVPGIHDVICQYVTFQDNGENKQPTTQTRIVGKALLPPLT